MPRCSSWAEAGKRGGCRGEIPRTPRAAGEYTLVPARSRWRRRCRAGARKVARELGRGGPARARTRVVMISLSFIGSACIEDSLWLTYGRASWWRRKKTLSSTKLSVSMHAPTIGTFLASSIAGRNLVMPSRMSVGALCAATTPVAAALHVMGSKKHMMRRRRALLSKLAERGTYEMQKVLQKGSNRSTCREREEFSESTGGGWLRAPRATEWQGLLHLRELSSRHLLRLRAFTCTLPALQARCHPRPLVGKPLAPSGRPCARDGRVGP